jgi:hypothetical protein
VKKLLFISGFCLCFYIQLHSKNDSLSNSSSFLKFIVYDFDGFDYGQNDLPDGDFRNGDLQYEVAGNPTQSGDMLGDRVLKINMWWNSGYGEFGKSTRKYFELNSGTDRFNFYFYNPTSSSGDAGIKVSITEDDDGNEYFDWNADDKWVADVTIPQSGGWQLISIPLSSFQDANPMGNGMFDAGFTGNGGMVFSINLACVRKNNSATEDHYYVDMICFSEGALPVGQSILDLPYKGMTNNCALGALTFAGTPDKTPGSIENIFNTGKKLTYVNWFLYYATSGDNPHVYPGQEVQNLINDGYQPIITWESMFASYSRLDPVQPRLNKIIDGTYDWYIDAFADKIKSYSGNVIMRILHEFEGDWYPWSLAENDHDPAKYISAFRHIVDRFRARGAYNAKWMWCLNADPKPYSRYNWVVSCYPGDNYVDIVATDVYNHPDLGTPPWRSFRSTISESYYYLAKYFPQKPLFICEVGCRERLSHENTSSQKKGDWLCEMDKDLQSNFVLAKSLIFFSVIKEHDWRVNSSSPARDAILNCIWTDSYYFGGIVGEEEVASMGKLSAFPNPFSDEINLVVDDEKLSGKNFEVKVFDLSGKKLYEREKYSAGKNIKFGEFLSSGIYILEFTCDGKCERFKIIKS